MKLNRRQFLAAAAVAPLFAQAPRQRFAYVGCADSIRVFAIGDGDQWTPVQKLISRRPAFFLLSETGTTLFAANAIDHHEGCPRGTVESYRVAADSGRLELLSRRPLSLSASRPSHLALWPASTGQYLIVAAFGGGAYNVLPVSPNGTLDHPIHIRKELGGGSHPAWQSSAHPHSVVSHEASGLIVSSDFGCDRLNVFQLHNGQLNKHSVCSVKSGDGPGAIAVIGNGRRLVIINTLSHSLSVREFDGASGLIGREVLRQPLINSPSIAGQCSMTVDSNAGLIYTSASSSVWGRVHSAKGFNPTLRSSVRHPATAKAIAQADDAIDKAASLNVWRFDARQDSIHVADTIQTADISERGSILLSDGNSLFTAGHRSHAIRHWHIDKVSGRLRGGHSVVNLPNPLTLVFNA